MNKYLVTAIALVGLSLLAPSCQQSDQPALTPSEVKQHQELTFQGELEEIQGDNARALQLELQRDAAGNPQRLHFRWVAGDTEPIYLLFSEGTNHQVVKGTLTFEKHEPSKKSYQVKISAQEPAGMNLSSGQVTVTGAIGVSELHDNGEAVIPSREYFITHGLSYCVPMYFAPARIAPTRDAQGQTRYRAEVSMKFYGSIIGIPLDNRRGNMSYQPREVVFTTNAFRTAGRMNLLSRDGAGVPSFTADAPRGGKQYVALDGAVLPKGQQRYDYFWIYPETYSGSSSDVTRPLTIEYHSGLSDATTGDSEIDVQRTLHMAQLPLHRIKHAPVAQALPVPRGGLIISEVFMGASPADFAWEFYNSSEDTLDLRDYYLLRENQDGTQYTTRLGDVMTYLYRTDGRFYVNKADQYGVRELLLLPKKSAVFYSTSVTTRSAYNNAAKPGLMYFFNLSHNVSPAQEYVDAFRVPQHARFALRSTRRRPAGQPARNLDAFFWFPDGEARGYYPTATFMRKPGHDVPREYMRVKSNSDWIMRERYEDVDWGYRFGFYNEGGTTRYLGVGNDMLGTRPLFDPDYSTGSLNFNQVRQQARTRPYTPPASWTREAALAADGQ